MARNAHSYAVRGIIEFALATVALATAARAVVNDVFAFAAVVPVAQPTAAFALAAAAAAQS